MTTSVDIFRDDSAFLRTAEEKLEAVRAKGAPAAGNTPPSDI